jgi:dipeptidyl aminopeptidase/acylaminoacyl peptidase
VVAVLSSTAAARPLTLADVQNVRRIDAAAYSPDGALIAVVVSRPEGPGEVYGRTFADADPGRRDIWLIDRASGTARDLTQGARTAAGYWCPAWSTDGRRLAMLSTAPEPGEPRGGNDVRLYVWTRGQSAPVRMAETGVMAETLGGSPAGHVILTGADGRVRSCDHNYGQNAPYLWLDSVHILAVTVPRGRRAPLLDLYARPLERSTATTAALRDGTRPTGVAFGSGDAATTAPERDRTAILVRYDVRARSGPALATVPHDPLKGALAIAVAPDARRAVILAPEAILPPVHGVPFPPDPDWQMQYRLGVLRLDSGGVCWAGLASPLPRPVALGAWDATGATVTVEGLPSRYADKAENYRFDVAALMLSTVPSVLPEAAKAAAPVPGLPDRAEVLDRDLGRGRALVRVPTQHGLFLREYSLSGRAPRNFLALDHYLAGISWGRLLTIGNAQHPDGLAILPPDYEPGRHYPVIEWVYPGYAVMRPETDYWTAPYLPEMYNLQLYAAQGYVVLIPSMPRRYEPDGHREPAAGAAADALKPLDALITMGVADPNRAGVFGQSFGGYGVATILTQTPRYKAGVAIAGLYDLSRVYNDIGSIAPSWPGIGQEYSDNMDELESTAIHLGGPPYKASDVYARNSPQAFAGKINAPLLLIHGEFDIRSPVSDAAGLYTELWRRGKTARLVIYGGESHAVSQSPANVRNVFDETLTWFGRYLR